MFLDTKDFQEGRHHVWEANYCVVVEGLISKTMSVKPLAVMEVTKSGP